MTRSFSFVEGYAETESLAKNKEKIIVMIQMLSVSLLNGM